MASLRARPSSSGIVVVRPHRQQGSWSHLGIIPLLGSTTTTPLNLKTWSGGRTRTTAPGLPYRHAIRAQGGAFGWPSDLDPDDDKPMTEEQTKKFRAILKKYCELDKDMPFREEIETIDEYSKKMTSRNTGIFHVEAKALSLHLCMVVRNGVELASTIMDSAIMKHDKQNVISSDKTKQTLAMYVSILVNLAEETYHKRFDAESVFSLLSALRGLAAISHILLEDALATDSSSSCSSLIDEIDSARSEFQQKMNALEDRFRAVSNSTKGYELLRHILFDSMVLTMTFTYKMVVKREMVLGIDSCARRRMRLPRISDDGEPDASGAASSGGST